MVRESSASIALESVEMETTANSRRLKSEQEFPSFLSCPDYTYPIKKHLPLSDRVV